MDKDLQLALLRNLILKTKIVIVFFFIVVFVQMIGLVVVLNGGGAYEIPLTQFVLVPVFIAVVIADEFIILNRLKRTLLGAKKFSDHWKYSLTVLEITYPSILIYFGSYVLNSSSSELTPYMFMNSPPYVVYFIFIILSAFYLDFKISMITGILAGFEYAIVNLMIFEWGELELFVNLSKAPFMIVTGAMAGIVAKKLKDSIVSSLESKNILINELDQKVAERTELIEEQKEQLASQFELLQERNQEITDSITYAKRIQSAILPTDEEFMKHLPQSFVLYKPKDIVAGDFYWLQESEGSILLAAADCTGHGVPGAMVSVVCNNALNRSVREHGLSIPGLILDKTRDIVVDEFTKGTGTVNDGMDIAICSLQGKKLFFSGANNPLWIIRKGSSEVEEIKATKQPVGKFDNPAKYETHEVHLEEGDTFYLFSDGFADQFGGEKGKKFKASNFKHLLLSLQDRAIQNHESLLEEAFESWRGKLEQVDDVCVIGVRV